MQEILEPGLRAWQAKPMAGPATAIDTTKAIALASQGLSQRVIADTLGCSYAALRQWFKRHSISHKVNQAKVSAVENKDSGLLDKASELTKHTLAAELIGQSVKLSQTGGSLGNRDGNEGKASVLTKLVMAGDKLFGWSTEQPEVVVHFHALGQSINHLALPQTPQDPAQVMEAEVLETPQDVGSCMPEPEPDKDNIHKSS